MRSGFSLIELLVAITILGLVVGIVAVAPGAVPRAISDPVSDTRAAALRTGRIVTAREVRDGLVIQVAAYPDGRAVAESSAAVADSGAR